MKNVLILCVFCFIITGLQAQRVNAKKIDVLTGKKILDSLPVTMQGNNRNTQNDKVFEASNLIGVVVHRDYGSTNKIFLEVVNNSLSVTDVNTVINQQPTNTSKYTITKLKGYVALVQPLNSEISKTGYELLLPISSTLVTFKAYGYTQTDFLVLANTIPIPMIARIVQ